MLCYQLLLYRLFRQYLHLQYRPPQVSENSAPQFHCTAAVSMRPIVSTTMTGIAMHNKNPRYFFTISSPLSRIYAKVTVTAMTKMMHQLLIVLFSLSWLFCLSEPNCLLLQECRFLLNVNIIFPVFSAKFSHLKTA